MAQAASQLGLLDRTPDPLIGRVIADRYRIVGHLGRGGMGVVYKVEHLRIGKLMAMKLLTGELSRSREVVRRFKREALAASRLASPNTVQVWDFGHADGLTYLVMELVVGEDLGRILKREGPFDFRRVAQIAAQVCNSMEEAHERGIVHRDIKPENILLLNPAPKQLGDMVKVLDFGLAKLHDEERPHQNEVTSTGAIVGTPFYMAPEQIRGEPVDGRADLYALGAVMYRAVAGAPPFSGSTPMAVLTQHLTEAPPPPTNVPPDAAAIILRCLEKKADDRYPNAAALRDALVGWLEGAGVSSGFLERSAIDTATRGLVRPSRASHAMPAATRREVRAWDRRRRKVSVVIALAAVVVVLALVAFARTLGDPKMHGTFTVEHEPNDEPQHGNPIALGAPVRGQLGKRLGPDRPDVDLYTVESSTGLLSLSLSPLPNMPMCLEVASDPAGAPLGRFCRPRAKRIEVSAFRVPGGRLWLRVTQDRSALEEGARPPVYENVSDVYELRVDVAKPTPSLEIEPNDRPDEAQSLAHAVLGSLGWRGDRDVFCAEGPARFVVENQSVLDASPIAVDGALIAPGVAWRGQLLSAGDKSCVTLRSARDGREDVRYRISVE